MENTTVSTLAEMEQLMGQWRAQKRHANERIPDTLRNQLLEILEKYPNHNVAQTLGLSYSTVFALRKMRHIHSSNKQANPQGPEQEDVHFIPFLPDTVSLASDKHVNPSLVTCQILHPNGAKLIINSSDLNGIIQAFLCCK